MSTNLDLRESPSPTPPAAAPVTTAGESTTFQQSWIKDALEFTVRRFRTILPIFLFIILLGVVITAITKPIFTSEAKLTVVTKSSSATASQSGAADVLSTLDFLTGGRTVDTQAEIVKSPDIIYPAFEHLYMDSSIGKMTDPQQIQAAKDRVRAANVAAQVKGFDPKVAYDRQTDAPFAQKQAEDATGHIKPGLNYLPPEWSYDVSSKQDTDVIVITTKARDRGIAAAFANSIAATYLAQNLAWNQQATHQAEVYVHDELEVITKELAQSSAKLAAYQKETGLFDIADTSSETTKIYVGDQNDSKTAAGDAKAARERLGFLRTQLKKLPTDIDFEKTITENPEYTLVRAEIVAIESQLARDKEEYAPTSTVMTELNNAVATDKKRLQALTQNLMTAEMKQANPVTIKLLGDFADATSTSMIADARLAALTNQVTQLNRKMQFFPGEIRHLGQLQTSVDVLTRTLNNLSDRYYSLLIEEKSSIPEGILTEKGRPPFEKSSPKWGLNLSFTLIFALLLSYSIAWLVEALDTKIHNIDQVEKVTGLAIVSVVPAVTHTQHTATIGNVEPEHAFLESFRLLRNNLRFAAVDLDVKFLAVTSSVKNEGKSTISQNLAIVSSLDGLKVLVIDCDLRRPSVHKKFQLTNTVGLTGAVTSNLNIYEVAQPSAWENVSVLTSGPLTPNPTEFLNADKTRRYIKNLADKYDLIILDSPPCMGLSDMQVISGVADAVVLVTVLEETARPVLSSAVHLLKQANAKVLGVVVNRAKKSSSSYYGSYYGYYTYYSYEDETAPKAKRKRKSKTTV